MPCDKREVELFLKQIKAHIKAFDIAFIDRNKNNLQNLAIIGITANQREDEILGLEVEDYEDGPKVETQFGGSIYFEFGKIINGNEVYIKITINETSGKVICISFHPAEYSFKFPFKLKTN